MADVIETESISNKENQICYKLDNDPQVLQKKAVNRYTNVRQTLTSIQRNKSKATTLHSVLDQGKSLVKSTSASSSSCSRQTLSTSSFNSSNRKPSESNSKNVVTLAIRKSISRPSKRDSLTLNVNPFLKKTSQTQTVNYPKVRKLMISKSARLTNASSNDDGPTVSSKIEFAIPANKFACNMCGKAYFFKTTLVAHQKSHTDVNSCQHCKRVFAFPTALHKHLRENCTKISIAERKNLLANDEKTSNTSNRRSHRTPNSKHSTDELLDFVSKSCSKSQSNRLKEPLEFLPHIKGVYRTPNKIIKCVYCDEKFKDAFSFATHAEHCAAGRANDEI